uniref:Uncharacterized protein n=1 Tax=Tanacetum cinerariifolium TaxID=118510 RepID=A0A6L2NKV5_TANCI|nr:hypothetical protein [Tanacetum cinerariifolium]
MCFGGKDLDFVSLDWSSVSFSINEKHETAMARWSKARTRAVEVGKRVSNYWRNACATFYIVTAVNKVQVSIYALMWFTDSDKYSMSLPEKLSGDLEPIVSHSYEVDRKKAKLDCSDRVG